ncbi:nitroreductase [Rhodoblastus sphagnicola]|uniref:Putative NAD(P)H nitroreductase n=1 Tax=Rhodoblastus sphagnicola TaxID=333368 RepID=A0A2S6N6Q4_9HYPH|nr:nitroreductase [Rhodoblastus sphagnicola]MBB4197597.1 nitroreductase [Rhodoblastus sphagnicola]PPQ30290.1 nitroreductase [Rhodoblastus sphagnicola]
MNDTLNLLARRRSAPPPIMKGPAPTRDEIEHMLALAARVPDHGKLAPWRFIVFEGEARDRAGALCAEIFHAKEPEAGEDRQASERARFSRAPLVIAVVSRAVPHVKIPLWEQELSAGAVCMALTVAAVALGFRTAWLTEWIAYDRAFLTRLGLEDHEKIAGYIHIGRVESEIEDRPRPDMAALTSYF